MSVHGKASVTAGLAVGTEVWSCWARIALDHSAQADKARTKLAAERTAGQTPDLNEELYPAMICIAASAAALDCFARVVGELVDVPKPQTCAERVSRAQMIWETLLAGFDVNSKGADWPGQLKKLFKLRNGSLHAATTFGATEPHPLGDPSTHVRTVYTCEEAARSVALMRDIFKTCTARVRPGLPLRSSQSLESRMSGFAGVIADIAP